MKAEDEKLERTCFNCSYCLMAEAEEPTEFGICLKDEAFDPFSEELLVNLNYAVCQELIDQKKFPGDREACPDFESDNRIEIDDDSPLGRELNRLQKAGELTAETFEQAVIEEQWRRIDWKTIPVDNHVKNLNSADAKTREVAIRSLGTLAGQGNRAAFEGLFAFLQAMPLARALEEVHLKKEILEAFAYGSPTEELAPFLIEELRRTPSNNTTRQWLSSVFRFLERCPWDAIHEPLERMLEDKKRSPRFKEKIEETLFQSETWGSRR
jgi:hypothetical protein